MPLSKHYIDTRETPVPVDRQGIVGCLARDFPEVVFVLLHGSAKSGIIRPHGDLDLAVFADPSLPGERFIELVSRISELHQGVRCDLGLLKGADPVYAFEASKGILIYCRSKEAYARFFSETCRRYEETMAAYARQLNYRRERSKGPG